MRSQGDPFWARPLTLYLPIAWLISDLIWQVTFPWPAWATLFFTFRIWLRPCRFELGLPPLSLGVCLKSTRFQRVLFSSEGIRIANGENGIFSFYKGDKVCYFSIRKKKQTPPAGETLF